MFIDEFNGIEDEFGEDEFSEDEVVVLSGIKFK